MLHIPQDLKRKNPWALIVMMGIAVICFLLAANALRTVAVAMTTGPVSG